MGERRQRGREERKEGSRFARVSIRVEYRWKRGWKSPGAQKHEKLSELGRDDDDDDDNDERTKINIVCV